jgi:DNA topoisomerase-1
LQQEASRKLGFGAQQTMRVAQQLYEGVDIGGETVGLITYLRTDGVQMAREAIHAIRDHVRDNFGKDYLPGVPREYSTKAKNAQEAHEAVRPTDVGRRPETMTRYLSHDQARLYELIWKRAVASQMAQAEFDQVVVDMGDGARNTLRANGSLLAFDGFLKLYREDRDDQAEDDDESRVLPPMTEGDPLSQRDIKSSQHFTQPPPRYTEASLVKKMEELGIGRPSTYASTLSVLRDRNYVRLDQKRLVPEDRGRLVTAFLSSFFNRYVDYSFTANLEEKLDEISDGRADWRAVMRAFWQDFSEAVDQTKDLKISDVINALDDDLGSHFFPPKDDGSDPRVCPACSNGRLGLKLGRHGSFIGCSNYPTCQYTRRLAVNGGEEGEETLKEGMRLLGQDPDTGEDVSVRRGPYGLYVQLGEPPPATEDKKAKKEKPKRMSLPRGMDGETISLDQALGLLTLPRLIGLHPETGEPMEAAIGRFGPYIRMGAVYASLDKDDDVLAVGSNRAVDLLAKKLASVRSLGAHPKDGEGILVKKGRFGPYAQHGKIVATLPRTVSMDDITLEEAVTLLAEKGKELKPKAGAKGKTAARAKPKATKAAAATGAAAKPKVAAPKKPAAAKKPVAAKKPAARKPARSEAAD